MIPVRLVLEGFLSYRGPVTIDFSVFDVACLVGANGRGKSSLLDAMTWALFGCARGAEGGQNQDRLIHEGAEQAQVQFDFELGGDVYRIVRKRSRSGRSELQFQLLDAGTSGALPRNLAAESLRETEALIADRLRLDYKTFCASALFVQGRADDFLSRMKPEERKDVFARLLDLGAYEKLAEAARARSRDADARCKELGRRLEEMTSQLSLLQPLLADLERAARSASAAADAVKASEEELEARREEEQRLEVLANEAKARAEALQELESRLRAEEQSVARHTAELARLDKLLTQKDTVRESLARREVLAARERELAEAKSASAELTHRRAELAGALEAERRELEAKLAEAVRRVDDTSRSLHDRRGDAAELTRLEEALADSEGAEDAVRALSGQLEDLRAEHGRLRQLEEMLRQQAGEQDEKLALLHDGGDLCPLCESKLGPDGTSVVLGRIRHTREQLLCSAQEASDRREEVAKEGKRLGEEFERLTKVCEQRSVLAQRASEARARAGLVTELERDLARVKAEAASLDETLRASGFAAGVRAALSDVNDAIAKIGYDASEHEQVRAALLELEPSRDLAGRIAEAERSRERVAGELGLAGQRRRALERDKAATADALSRLSQAEPDAARVRERVREAKTELDQKRANAENLRLEVARMQERRESLERLDAETEQVRGAESEAAAEKRLWERLGKAFGRGGIPDLIIDNVLPGLGQDASDILGALTNYEMSLQFTMSKPTKGGKVRETLDVLVNYDGGVRDFAMFSGGEAFRIAFAIRLALSKLLVRRSGARLETLVIDEGFGTQDAEGRERLVEVINLARREFRKVLVVTHIDELKDAFGAQLRVTRDPRTGSTVEVVTAG